ncbi:MAG: hypothetical protein PHD00_11490 [Bacteroidales bacterium]|nr:hypothetical protein [Bacteroidales bacterium]MDD4673930.1 hypothetical protein [Bacteroidales bacterium]
MKKTRVIVLAAVLGFGVLPINTQAQHIDSTRIESGFFQSIRANQVDSYITFGQGFGNVEPLIFEGLISPYFLLRTSRNARWGATISPAIRLRMEAKESFPIRAPSYMPNITFYHQISRENDDIKYLFMSLVHHSNGQDGNFKNDDGTYNVQSGDFSTNMIEVGAFFNKTVLPFTNTREYFQSSVEYHLNVARSEELEGVYSFLRWHNNIRIFRFPLPKSTLKWLEDKTQLPEVQTNIKTTWMFGDVNNATFFDLAEHLNLSFTISYRPQVLNDVSFFVTFYTGKDYYNMHFARRIQVLQFGLQAYAIK